MAAKNKDKTIKPYLEELIRAEVIAKDSDESKVNNFLLTVRFSEELLMRVRRAANIFKECNNDIGVRILDSDIKSEIVNSCIFEMVREYVNMPRSKTELEVFNRLVGHLVDPYIMEHIQIPQEHVYDGYSS